jgi:hypothetical protein
MGNRGLVLDGGTAAHSGGEPYAVLPLTLVAAGRLPARATLRRSR